MWNGFQWCQQLILIGAMEASSLWGPTIQEEVLCYEIHQVRICAVHSQEVDGKIPPLFHPVVQYGSQNSCQATDACTGTGIQYEASYSWLTFKMDNGADIPPRSHVKRRTDAWHCHQAHLQSR